MPQQVLTAALHRAILSTIVFFVFLAMALFLPAGDPGWAKGQLFFLVFLVLMALGTIYLWRANPDIFVARRKIHAGTKGWDKVLVRIMLLVHMAEFPLASLDDGRFHWSSVPPWLVALGYVLLLAGFSIVLWAEKVNKFAEPGVRIQAGQKVVDSGPYAIVRHPMYVGAVLLFIGIALALGSYWALIPATLAAMLLVPRTVLEDKTLREELQGYREYAARVRYRLLPGIW